MAKSEREAVLMDGEADDEGDVEYEDKELRKLDLEHTGLDAQLVRSRKDSLAIQETSKAIGEYLDRVRSRCTAVTAELGEALLRADAKKEKDDKAQRSRNAERRSSSHEAGADGLSRFSDDTEALAGALEASGALVRYDEAYSSTVRASFQRAIERKLTDARFAHRLTNRHRKADVIHIKVNWGSESVVWKVHDDADGTESIFDALLHDACRYWGVDAPEMSLVDERGAVWPLEGLLQDEAKNPKQGTKRSILLVNLTVNPHRLPHPHPHRLPYPHPHPHLHPNQVRALGVKEIFLKRCPHQEQKLTIAYEKDTGQLTRAERRIRAKKERDRLETLQALRVRLKEKASRRYQLPNPNSLSSL